MSHDHTDNYRVIFVLTDGPINAQQPDITGPGAAGHAPNTPPPAGLAVTVPSVSDVVSALSILARAIPDVVGAKAGLLSACSIMCRYSQYSQTLNIREADNPPLNYGGRHRTFELPKGSTRMVAFRGQLYATDAPEREALSFIRVMARHCSSLEGLVAMAAHLTGVMTQGIQVALKCYSLPLSVLSGNAAGEVVAAGDTDVRGRAAAIVVPTEAHELSELASVARNAIEDIYGLRVPKCVLSWVQPIEEELNGAGRTWPSANC
eukprot:5264881-Amphidinium_carterae.1